MISVNIIHCCPEGLPEEVFRHFSPETDTGRQLLDSQCGWIAAYGPFLADDGQYLSEGDAKVRLLKLDEAYDAV